MSNRPARPPRRPFAVRRGSAVGASVLLIGVLTACGSGGSDPSESAEQASLGEGESVTITTFGEFGYDELIEEWNAEHPEIPVEQTKVSLWDDWKAELNTNLQAGSGLPDVVAIEGDFMPAIIAAPDRWVDVSSDDLAGRWLPFKADGATTADGALLGYATDAGPEAICYRKDLLAEAGLPSEPDEVAARMGTWEDYYAFGEDFVAASDAAWYDSSGTVLQAMLNQVPYPFETAENEVDVDNPELAAVWDTVAGNAETLSTGNAQWSDDWTASFTSDGFATLACPGWMRSVVKDNAGEGPDAGEWAIADAFPGGGGNWGGSYLTIPKTSTHQTEAMQFASWITAPEQQARIFEEYGNFPSQVDALSDPTLLAATDPYFGDAPVGEIYANRAEAIDVQPYHGPLYSDILGALQQAITRVDQGTSAGDSWQTFVRDVEALQ